MIRSMEDTRRIADEITKLAHGECELCGLEIGNKYVFLGQILPCEAGEDHTIEVRYQVACSECFRHIDALIRARRSLNSNFEETHGAGV